ncbi:MAG: sugar ABC transporter permease [Anaerolineae bacterium]|nr:sugar ABC transporter permease [Anaerolineae bacterium]MDW8098801.1 sugar ABC transporter permease [Anaerolineae bacterium]
MARRPRSKLMRREAIDGYLFIAPWLLGFILWVAGPMIASIVLSLMRWDLFSPPVWVGLENFKQLFRNPLVGVSLWNTAFYTFLSVPLNLIVALTTALLLNQQLRFQAWFRTFFYLPSIMPAVANAVLWFWILNPEVGLANALLRMLGLPELQWLWHPATAKPSFILMGLWGTGNTMVIFLAGLQGIPQSLYEAAEIDGANGWQRFRSVTIPMLSPVILFNLVLGIIGSFQIFTSAYLLTNGGPQNSTLFTVLYLYRLGFEQFNMGFASALAWLLFAIILAFTLAQLRLSRAWVYYEGGEA